MTYTKSENSLKAILGDWRLLLKGWSSDGTLGFATREALDLNEEPLLLRELVEQWAGGDFSRLPAIELLEGASMAGALGAYAESTQTIYLNEDWLLTADRRRVFGILTEELGHFLDARLNLIDTPGDEGQQLATLIAGLNPETITARGHFGNDTAEIALNNGTKVQAELAAGISDQVLWSQKIGRRVQGELTVGKLLGIDNQKSYKAFLGVAPESEKNKYNTYIGPTFNGIKESVGFDKSFSIFGISASAKASAGLASEKDRNNKATIKAGLELDTGYNLGGVKWDLPLTADLDLSIRNNSLVANLKSDIDNSYIDFMAPQVYLYLRALVETDAAVYLDASASASGYGMKKSIDFNKKLSLSTSWSHNFIQIDSTKSEQYIDWISGRKSFKTGALAGSRLSPAQDFGLFSGAIGLPDFGSLKFNRLLDLPSLSNLLPGGDLSTRLASPGAFKDSLVYSAKGEYELFKSSFDLDGFISKFLPFPISFKDSASFKLSGKELGGYDVSLGLIDINPTLQLNLGYQLDIGITDLLPRLEVENGKDASNNLTWNTFDLQQILQTTGGKSLDLSLEQDRVTLGGRLNGFDSRGNVDNNLDLRAVFDPSVFINARLYLKPIAKIETGIGEVKLNLRGPGFDFNIPKSGKFYLIDTPDPEINLGDLNILDLRLSKKLKDIVDLSWANLALPIPLEPINKILGVNVINGTNNPDYRAGTDGNDFISLFGGDDVAKVSKGKDIIDGGTDTYGSTDTPTPAPTPFWERIGLLDLFGNTIRPVLPVNTGDTLIVDSSLIPTGNSSQASSPKAKLSLQTAYNEFNRRYETKFAFGENSTTLSNFENLILSDDLQSSTLGIDIDLRSGGLDLRRQFPASSYSKDAPLPKGRLTGTNGNDILRVPPRTYENIYKLGAGDDQIEFTYNIESARVGLTRNWKNPWVNKLTAADRFSFLDTADSSIDLGSGNNKVIFIDSDSGSPLIASVNPGSINTISGRKGGAIRLQNLGGAVDTSQLLLDGKLLGIIDAGGNTLDLTLHHLLISPGKNTSDITILPTLQGLKGKLGLGDIEEIKMTVNDDGVTYESGGKTTKDIIRTSYDPDAPFNYLTIARSGDDLTDYAYDGFADIDSLYNVINANRYSLAQPSRQTVEIDTSTTKGRVLQITGRSPNQPDTYRKVVIKNIGGESVVLGNWADDIFDDVVIENASSPSLAFTLLANANRLAFNSSSEIKAVYEEQTSGSISYSYLTAFNAPKVSLFNTRLPAINDSNLKPADIAALAPSIQPIVATELLSGKNTYAPIRTLYLGSGDDVVIGDSSAYEWFYPGAGNNVIGSLGFNSQFPLYITYEPIQGLGRQTEDVRMGDVVVYTDGSSQDYLITREGNVIKVVKPDKTVDYLFGISLIKFETEDAAAIIAPKERLANLEKISKPIEDLFGNNIDNRVFVNRAVNEDGGIVDVRLYGTGYDRDIVRLDSEQIYQPGTISKADAIELPSGTKSFTLAKQQLLSRYADNDIASKKLYTTDQIQIENLSVYRGSAVISKAAKQADGGFTVDLSSPLNSSESSVSIGYEVVEPEGYRHFSIIDLELSTETESSTIKVSQGGGTGDTVDAGISALSELTRTKALTSDANALLSRYKLYSDPTAQSEAINGDTSFIDFTIKTKSLDKLVVESTLDTEVRATSFVKVNPNTGEAFDFTYDPVTGLGAELLDTNKNGLVDSLRFHLQDGAKGDVDGLVNGEIRDPGVLADAPRQSVYRFFKASKGVHLYTSSDAERANVNANPEWGYKDEGVAYDALVTQGKALHRFFNAKASYHFMTTNDEEAKTVKANPKWGFSYEGESFSVSTIPQLGMSTPVNRFYRVLDGVGQHFYTASSDEASNINAHPEWGYKSEGVGWYV